MNKNKSRSRKEESPRREARNLLPMFSRECVARVARPRRRYQRALAHGVVAAAHRPCALIYPAITADASMHAGQLSQVFYTFPGGKASQTPQIMPPFRLPAQSACKVCTHARMHTHIRTHAHTNARMHTHAHGIQECRKLPATTISMKWLCKQQPKQRMGTKK